MPEGKKIPNDQKRREMVLLFCTCFKALLKLSVWYMLVKIIIAKDSKAVKMA